MDINTLLKASQSLGGGGGEIPPPPPLQAPLPLNKRSFTMMEQDEEPEPSHSDIYEALMCCMNMLAALIKKTKAEEELQHIEKA